MRVSRRIRHGRRVSNTRRTYVNVENNRQQKSTSSSRRHKNVARQRHGRRSSNEEKYNRGQRSLRGTSHHSQHPDGTLHAGKLQSAQSWQYRLKAVEAAGIRDAMQWAKDDECLSPAKLVLQMNERFVKVLEQEGIICYPYGTVAYPDIVSLSHSYVNGYASMRNGAGGRAVLLPTTAKLGVVLCAYNEQESIIAALEQLTRLPLQEIVIVVNGSVDATFEFARAACREAVIVHFANPLGHDVGRAIGAKLLQADAILFTDSDFAISAEQLGTYVWSAAAGVDVALNDIRSFIGSFDQLDGISYCKQWLNHELGRSDLGLSSMTAIPHALSSHAIQTIGHDALCAPPRAHALAVLHGLNVRNVSAVDVISHNRVRKTNIGDGNPVSQLIIGDHMEALEAVWDWKRDELNSVQLERAEIAWRRNR